MLRDARETESAPVPRPYPCGELTTTTGRVVLLTMPFYAVGEARQSPAEPLARVLQRCPGQLGANAPPTATGDARRRARAQTAFDGSLTMVGIVACGALFRRSQGRRLQ
ncbi:MAG: hypothetical protein OXG44_10080 [Gammaproteobacteria bacterium]|nr:hypothetical protein [Gammaproteobacteria bacterium]